MAWLLLRGLFSTKWFNWLLTWDCSQLIYFTFDCFFVYYFLNIIWFIKYTILSPLFLFNIMSYLSKIHYTRFEIKDLKRRCRFLKRLLDTCPNIDNIDPIYNNNKKVFRPTDYDEYEDQPNSPKWEHNRTMQSKLLLQIVKAHSMIRTESYIKASMPCSCGPSFNTPGNTNLPTPLSYSIQIT
jgi:hypothetical protein